VDNAATLELAGTASNLTGGSSQPVNVTNTSTAAAGVEVSGTHQAVGRIAGTGNLAINAGADLTANAVVQGALVIGGTAGNPATLTIAASNASGNPLDAAHGGPLAGVSSDAPVTGAEPPAPSFSVTSSAIVGGQASGADPTIVPQDAVIPLPFDAAALEPSSAFVLSPDGSAQVSSSAAANAQATPQLAGRPQSIAIAGSNPADDFVAASHDDLIAQPLQVTAAIDVVLADTDLQSGIDDGLLDLLAGIAPAK
jgi:hypothetical protein